MKTLYSKSHEWIKLDGNVAEVGITSFAASELGDIVYVELPEINRNIREGDTVAEIESVKAVSEIFSPLTGIIEEVNEELEDTPEKINEDAENTFIFKLRFTELPQLMTKAEYDEFVKN